MPSRPATTTSLYRNVDAMTGGQLADIIRSEREAESSWLTITKRLHSDHGVEVSVQTLINWARSLGIEPEGKQPVAS